MGGVGGSWALELGLGAGEVLLRVFKGAFIIYLEGGL